MSGGTGLPGGTVTFVFTDVVGSTALWERAPDVMGPAMARHDVLVEAAVAEAGGELVRPRGEGDSRFAVFARAGDALAGAVGIQRALGAEPWPTPKPIVARIAVHTGEATLRDGDYYGSDVNRCARLRSLAHPGQILVSQATVDLAGGAVRLRDLGVHRLKDLSAPEHVHQVEHPDIRSDFPPLVSVSVVPNNLPVTLTGLVGRRELVDELTDRLGPERLITVTGPGGTGKSRLSLAVAGEVTARFPDGVWFVELASLADPSLVAPTVASVLGAGEDAPGLGAALAAGSADARVLLVLDNCEHVIGAAAEVVATVLRSTTGLCVLATSQEPLGVVGEVVVPISSLDPDAALELFAERARAVHPGFSLEGAEGDAARAICARLDGIPLALELAATRVRAMSAVQVAERLDDRFRLLTGGSRTAPERHRTLAAAIEWTHDLLTEPEQVLYRRLGAFTGGASLAAIEAVCTAAGGVDPFDLDDLLQGLVDRSLVVLDRTLEPPRFRMLETILAHARTKLDPDEHRALRDLHLAHVAHQAAAGLAGLRSSDAAAWLPRLRADHDNLRAALAWALEGGDPMVGLHAAGQSSVFWMRCGLVDEPTRWLRALLDATPPEPTRARAVALGAVATFVALLRLDPAGLALLDEAAAIATSIGDVGLAAEQAHIRGVARANQSGAREGTEDLERAIELYEQIGDEERTAAVSYVLGEILIGQDRPRPAMAPLRAAQQHAIGHGDLRKLAQASACLVLAHLDVGDLDGAAAAIGLGRFEEARALDDVTVTGPTVVAEAEYLVAAGRAPAAAAFLVEHLPGILATEDGADRGVALETAAVVLSAVDPAGARWAAAAAVEQAETTAGRVTPRGERSLARIDAAARAAFGGDDPEWRDGAAAAANEVDERVLAALRAVAAAPG